MSINQTISELYEALYNAKKELFSLRLQVSLKQITQTHFIRQRRRDCARLLTKINALKQQQVSQTTERKG